MSVTRTNVAMLPDHIVKMYKKAKAVRNHAFAPFSGFRVGAAIRLTNGKVFVGCNVEDPSYGLTVCAERVAIFTARSVLGGAMNPGDIEVVFVVTDPPPGNHPAPPCGGCRSVIATFDHADTVVYASNLDGSTVLMETMGLLLPLSFERQFAGMLIKKHIR
jgi:homotetrameric cytidine deaminase